MTNAHPYRSLVMFFATILVVYLAAGTVANRLHLEALALYAMANAALAVIGAGILVRRGWWTRVGFRRPKRWRTLWLFWLPFVTILAHVVGGIPPTSVPRVAIFVAIAMTVGFVEEMFFRGLMLRPLLGSKGPWRAALITTVLFGVMHRMNTLAGWDALSVALQISYAAAIGFGYAALVIQTGLIWPLVLAHGLTDVFGLLSADTIVIRSAPKSFAIAVSVVIIVVNVAYGIYLLRSGRSAIRGDE